MSKFGEEIKEIVDKIEKEDARSKEQDSRNNEKIRKTDAFCIVCKGSIVEAFDIEFNPINGPPILGPDGKYQWRRYSKGFHCETCGIKYYKLPSQSK